MKTCLHCGEPLTGNQPRQKYCSTLECQRARNRAKDRARARRIREKASLDSPESESREAVVEKSSTLYNGEDVLRALNLDPDLYVATNIRAWTQGDSVAYYARPVLKSEWENLEASIREDVEAIAKALGGLQPFKGKVGDGAPRTVILPLGDLQIGKNEGTEQRLAYVVERWLEIIAQAQIVGPVDEIVISLGGDCIEGLGVGAGIGHHWQIEDPHLTSQVRRYIQALATLLLALRTSYPEVFTRVIGVRGNHGRNNPTVKGLSADQDNWDTAAPLILSDFCEWHPLLKDVAWEIEVDKAWQVVDIKGFGYYHRHGHDIGAKSSDTAPAKLRTLISNFLSDRRNPDIHIAMLYHFHVPYMGMEQQTWLFVNGSCDGGSPHFTDRTHRSVPDLQLALVVAEGEGLVSSEWIRLPDDTRVA